MNQLCHCVILCRHENSNVVQKNDVVEKRELNDLCIETISGLRRPLKHPKEIWDLFILSQGVSFYSTMIKKHAMPCFTNMKLTP